MNNPGGGKALCVHACRLEHRPHVMPLCELDSSGIGLRSVEKDGLVWDAGSQSFEKLIGCLTILGEERTYLETQPAWAHHAVANEALIVHHAKSRSLRLLDPTPQKVWTRSRKDRRVIACYFFERNRGQVDEAVGSLSPPFPWYRILR